MDSKRLVRSIDFGFLIFIAGILAMSSFVLSSATLNVSTDPLYYVKKHLVWITAGIIAMVIIATFNYNSFKGYCKPIYVVTVLSLLVVLAIGKESSWIPLGSYQLQPSEFAKIAIIVTFAKFLTERQGKLNTLRELIPCFLHVGIPMLLIVPADLGTSLVFIAITLGMLFVAGANIKLLLKIFGGGFLLLVLILIAHFKFGMWLPLEEYQLMRLVVFLDPYNDGYNGRGYGYHIIQSQVAIGSGGIFGKGLYHGSQVQLNFLPEHHTDFIFSVVGEELGFVGAVGLLVMYFGLLYRAVSIAKAAKDLYGTLLVTGVVSMILFHVLENIGMSMGLMPITGIPLPLFSYGGSSMLATMAALGLVLNVNIRRQIIRF